MKTAKINEHVCTASANRQLSRLTQFTRSQRPIYLCDRDNHRAESALMVRLPRNERQFARRMLIQMRLHVLFIVGKRFFVVKTLPLLL